MIKLSTEIEMGGIGSVIRIAGKISRNKAVRCSCLKMGKCSSDHPATPLSWSSGGFGGMSCIVATGPYTHLPPHMASFCRSFSNYTTATASRYMNVFQMMGEPFSHYYCTNTTSVVLNMVQTLVSCEAPFS